MFMRASVFIRLHIPCDMRAGTRAPTHRHTNTRKNPDAYKCKSVRVRTCIIVAIYVVRSEEADSELLGGGWFCTLKIEWMPGPLLWAAAIRMHRLLRLK